MGRTRKYIDNTAEEALLNYEYHGADYSILSKAFQPLWNFVCHLLPEWMAPNLVTFLGFACVIVVFIATIITHPAFEMDTSVSYYPVMFVSFAILIWMYQTLDAVDGKQTRRTKSSSPLGELFDHGCDALTTVFQTALGCSMFQYGNSSAAFFLFVGTMTTSHIVFFEEYVTLTLRFGLFNSVTEILTLYELLMIFTGLTRGYFWTFEIGFLSELFGERVTIGWVMALLSFVVIPLNLYDCLKYSLQEIRKQTPQIVERNMTPLLAVRSLLSGCVTVIIYIVWFFIDNEFYRKYVFLFCVTFAVQMAYLSTRMIIHRVCKQKMKAFYFVLVPILGGFVTCNFVVADETLKLYMFIGMLIGTIAIYAHFVYYTINEITEVLGIYLFSLKRRKSN